MKIFYNKRQLKLALIFGLIWIIIGVISIITKSENNFFSGFLFIGIAYLILYFIKRYTPYVLITDEFIQVNNYIRTKIYFKDIKEIKYFAGDYFVKSRHKELTIDTNYVDKESLPLLKEFIEKRISAIKPSGNTG